MFTDAYNDGARIHSNSWGSQQQPRQVHRVLRGRRRLRVQATPTCWWSIAAGNSGAGASTVSAPGTAKNCLTVGAVGERAPAPGDHHHRARTCRTTTTTRPTADQRPADAEQLRAAGRQRRRHRRLLGTGAGQRRRRQPHQARHRRAGHVHPVVPLDASARPTSAPTASTTRADIDHVLRRRRRRVATHAEAVGRGLPGAPFFGTWNQNTPAAPAGSGPLAQQNYFYDSGTSMATPITSGAMALLRQYLRQRRGIANPSAALMKAMFVNAAAVPAAALDRAGQQPRASAGSTSNGCSPRRRPVSRSSRRRRSWPWPPATCGSWRCRWPTRASRCG